MRSRWIQTTIMHKHYCYGLCNKEMADGLFRMFFTNLRQNRLAMALNNFKYAITFNGCAKIIIDISLFFSPQVIFGSMV